jgi:RimJ/RimL family protein N-acetyltransferase
MFIGLLQDEPVGQVRFDKENEAYIVDYSVVKSHRGKGLGAEIVATGIQILNETIYKPFTIVAWVKEENIASAKVFAKLHFTKTATIPENNSTLSCYKLTIT